MRFLNACLAGLLFCFITMGCTGETGSNLSAVSNQDTTVGTGTIAFLSIEGGFYAIRSDEGTVYDPQDLPNEFQVDGLRVRFVVRVLRQALGFHMVGPIVRVLDIERL
jgi:hypothetical protein